MIRQTTAEKLPHTLHFFYSDKRPEDAPFLEELQKLADANPSFHFVPTMTDMAQSGRPWHGATGFIDTEMLLRRLSNLHGPIYYVAGPPGMVAATRETLSGAGIDQDDIRTEEFAGY